MPNRRGNLGIIGNAMYIPPHNREDDLDTILAFAQAHPFAILVTGGDNGNGDASLCATHLPVLIEQDADGTVRLVGHIAKANAQRDALAAGATALVIFQGPHAYISPRWYENPLSVPTWNYIAVHAYGPLRLLESEAAKRANVDALVRHFDPAYEPQHQSLPDDFLAAKLKGILVFDLPVNRWEARYKLSQDRPPIDRATVADALTAQTDDSAAVETGLLVAERLNVPPTRC